MVVEVLQIIDSVVEMTSPKKSLEAQKESTLFGELSHVEKQTSRMSKQLVDDIENLKKINLEFLAIEKQAKFAAEDSKVRLSTEIHVFEEKIKNYLIVQKAEYGRVANQINQLIVNHKEINSQLLVLQSRFQQFEKNVGV